MLQTTAGRRRKRISSSPPSQASVLSLSRSTREQSQTTSISHNQPSYRQDVRVRKPESDRSKDPVSTKTTSKRRQTTGSTTYQLPQNARVRKTGDPRGTMFEDFSPTPVPEQGTLKPASKKRVMPDKAEREGRAAVIMKAGFTKVFTTNQKGKTVFLGYE